MSGTEFLGWASSLILIATLSAQLHKQWREKTSKGVSKWLFIGQVASEIGFITYSWLLNNWVFAVTNGVLLLQNMLGIYLTLKYRKQQGGKSQLAAEDESVRRVSPIGT